MDHPMIDLTERKFDALFDSSSSHAYLVDYRTGEILALTDAVSDRLRKSKNMLIGACCHEAMGENNHLCANCPVKNGRFSSKEIGYAEQFHSYFHHLHKWLKVSLRLVSWRGERKALLVSHQELSHEETAAQDCENVDLWDSKFVLPNATCLERDFGRACAQSPSILICLDIISLRTINDSFGRKVGDMLLFVIRDWILSLNLGQLYRLESDEFGLLLTGADMDTAMQIARRIGDRFKDAWDISLPTENRRIYCAVSMGVISSEAVYTPGEILSVVERVLRTASEQECIAVYNAETNRELARHLEMEVSLQNCVKNHMQGFSVHYQPIINSITGLWCGIEALCRWSSPVLGAVPPLEFIPIAERQGLISAIGEWVLEMGIKQCKDWHLDTHEDFILDVNLSPVQLLDGNLDAKVLDILESYNYPSRKLCLEITESTQLNFDAHTLDAILRLTKKNISIALDDFGTGYSSFHSLINMPVSILKSERAFINNIENDKYLQRLLDMMVSLAHASGMKMTAEGVETAEQMKILMDSRVDYVQGYLFSKPLPREEFGQKLRNFYHKEENSVAGGYSRIDLETLRQSENAYSLPPSLYRTLIRCMQILFNTSDIDVGIHTVFALIGEQLGINRHVLFLRDSGTDTFSNTHEWCDDNTPSNIDRNQNIPIQAATPSFIPLFEKEGMIVSPDIATLPEDIYRMFAGIGVKSNIAIPLWRGSELLGYVGLDAVKERRNWHPEEVLLVHSVCGILANVLDRVLMRKEMEQRQ